MRNQKTKRGCSNPETDTNQMGSLEGYQASGSGHKAIRNPAIFKCGGLVTDEFIEPRVRFGRSL